MFGCACFPLLKPYATNKLEAQSIQCVFMGYSSNVKGYRCYDMSSGKMYISTYVQFREFEFPFAEESGPGSFPPSSPILGMDPSSLSKDVFPLSASSVPASTSHPTSKSDNPQSGALAVVELPPHQILILWPCSNLSPNIQVSLRPHATPNNNIPLPLDLVSQHSVLDLHLHNLSNDHVRLSHFEDSSSIPPISERRYQPLMSTLEENIATL